MECSICLELKFDENIYPCSHFVCTDCFEINPNRFQCPICRQIYLDIDLCLIKFKKEIIVDSCKKTLLILSKDRNEQLIFVDKMRKFITDNQGILLSRVTNNWEINAEFNNSAKYNISVHFVNEEHDNYEIAAWQILPTCQVSKDFILKKYYNSKKRKPKDWPTELLLLIGSF